MNKVRYIQRYDVNLDLGELTTLQVGLDTMIRDYQEILDQCSENDKTSSNIFKRKLADMLELKERLENLF